MTRWAALLPMKGHSERVPKKNLRVIAGKPLFAWVLEALEAVGAVDVVVVNTDCDNIASAVQNFKKVKVHRRPEELCGDFVSMNRIIEYDVERLSKYEHFIQTHATNPLLRADTIEKLVTEFGADGSDSTFTVTEHYSRFYDDKGVAVNHDPSMLVRTQDLTPLLEENSVAYLFTRESFRGANHRIGTRPRPTPVSALEAVDIDTPTDWTIASALMEFEHV